MYIHIPTTNSGHHSRSMKIEPSTPIAITTSSSVRTGLLPRPNFATSPPPMRKPVDAKASANPHVCALNSVSPYGSISAM